MITTDVYLQIFIIVYITVIHAPVNACIFYCVDNDWVPTTHYFIILSVT